MNKPFFPGSSPAPYVNIGEAKTHLSELIARAERGETITLARNGVPVASIGPLVKASKGPRKPGIWKDLLTQEQQDFLLAPLPPEEQAALEGAWTDGYGVLKPEFAGFAGEPKK